MSSSSSSSSAWAQPPHKAVEESGDDEVKKPQVTGNELWIFMLDFVIASGLQSHDDKVKQRREDRWGQTKTRKRKIGRNDDDDEEEYRLASAKRDDSAWEQFLVGPNNRGDNPQLSGSTLYDPRLFLTIAYYACETGDLGQAFDINPYDQLVLDKIRKLREWEKKAPLMAIVEEKAEALCKVLEPASAAFQKALHDAMGVNWCYRASLKGVVERAQRHHKGSRPKLVLSHAALFTSQRKGWPEWRGPVPWGSSHKDLHEAATRNMLNDNPWLDVREGRVPGRPSVRIVATPTFLIRRFQYWDAKTRLPEELKELKPPTAPRKKKPKPKSSEEEPTKKPKPSEEEPNFTGMTIVDHPTTEIIEIDDDGPAPVTAHEPRDKEETEDDE